MLLTFDSYLSYGEYWSLESEECLAGEQHFSQAVSRMLEKIKKTLPRQEGFGWRLQKFHDLTHIAREITRFGRPSNWDAGASEHNLIAHAKKPGRSSQKRGQDIFLGQAADRAAELQFISQLEERIFTVAEDEEEDGSTDNWTEKRDSDDSDDGCSNDVSGYINANSTISNNAESYGPSWKISKQLYELDIEQCTKLHKQRRQEERINRVNKKNRKNNKGEIVSLAVGATRASPTLSLTDTGVEIPKYQLRMTTKSKNFVEMHDLVIRTIVDFAVWKNCKKVLGFTECKMENVTYRAHPNYQGQGAWYDWAMVDYSPSWEHNFPGKIWGFFQLHYNKKNHLFACIQETTMAVVGDGGDERWDSSVTKDWHLYYKKKQVQLKVVRVDKLLHRVFVIQHQKGLHPKKPNNIRVTEVLDRKMKWAKEFL